MGRTVSTSQSLVSVVADTHSPPVAVAGVRAWFDEETRARILRRVDAILQSGHLTLGPTVEEFEAKFAAYIGTKHAIAVNSGASALMLALKFFALDDGEVLVPVETFVASANAVIVAGGRPTFVNIEAETLSADPEDLATNIHARTRGIMLVHMAGQITPHLATVQRLCAEHGLFLIEDAAHAHGSRIGERMAGTLGDVGCFSLYSTKVLTSGEGGVITTNNDELADYARSLRNHGLRKDSILYESVSLNYRLAEIPAAVAIEQLASLEAQVCRRNEIVDLYRQKLAGHPDLEILPECPGGRSAHWKVYARLSPRVDRAQLIKLLAERYRIATHYAYKPLCHLQPVFAPFVSDPLRFGRSEAIMAHLICLPVSVGLENLTVAYVAERLDEALRACRTP